MYIIESGKEYKYGCSKISFKDNFEFGAKLRQIQCSKILHMVYCTPDFTDTKTWVKVYYEIEIKKSQNTIKKP